MVTMWADVRPCHSTHTARPPKWGGHRPAVADFCPQLAFVSSSPWALCLMSNRSCGSAVKNLPQSPPGRRQQKHRAAEGPPLRAHCLLCEALMGPTDSVKLRCTSPCDLHVPPGWDHAPWLSAEKTPDFFSFTLKYQRCISTVSQAQIELKFLSRLP